MDKEAIMDLEVDKNNNSDIHHVNINNNIKSKNYTREATNESSLNPQLISELCHDMIEDMVIEEHSSSDDSLEFEEDDFSAGESRTAAEFTGLPIEVVEYILSLVPDPVSQRRFSQVCKLWRDIVYRLRWLRLLSFERKVHLRLPLAGSLNEIHGNKGFSIILQVSVPVLLAGAAVFLPYRDNFDHDVSGVVELTRHGTPHIGPSGDTVARATFNVTRAAGLSWQEDCRGTNPICLQGPWQKTRSGGTLGGGCVGLHPLPVLLPHLAELEAGVRYMLSLRMVSVKRGGLVSETVGTVWGFQGVPKRKSEPDQNHFRWFQVYRSGLSSSVSSGQFPIIYYIA